MSRSVFQCLLLLCLLHVGQQHQQKFTTKKKYTWTRPPALQLDLRGASTFCYAGEALMYCNWCLFMNYYFCIRQYCNIANWSYARKEAYQQRLPPYYQGRNPYKPLYFKGQAYKPALHMGQVYNPTLHMGQVHNPTLHMGQVYKPAYYKGHVRYGIRMKG